MANQADFPVRTLCRALKVSVSGFTAWRDRKPSRRTIENTLLTEQIRSAQVASDSTYGRDRVRAERRDQGVQANHQRIARLMRLAGMRGVSRRRGFVVTTRREPGQGRAPHLVPRQFKARGPNPLWVADLTDVPTWAGFIFLAVVIEVWSRRVVGGSIGEHRRAELVLAALNRAIPWRQPDAVVHHRDQGSQYASLAFGKRCQDMGGVRRWARSARPTTRQWRRASSPAWKVNCSTAAPSRRKPKTAWPSFPGSKAGTTRAAAIRRSVTGRPSTSRRAKSPFLTRPAPNTGYPPAARLRPERGQRRRRGSPCPRVLSRRLILKRQSAHRKGATPAHLDPESAVVSVVWTATGVE